jgi:fructosamine-3-kinase
VIPAPTFVAMGTTDGTILSDSRVLSTWRRLTTGRRYPTGQRADGIASRPAAPPSAGPKTTSSVPPSQRNTPHARTWPHFFGEHRLRPQLALARQNGMDPKLVAKGLGVVDCLGGLFIDYHPLPSLCTRGLVVRQRRTGPRNGKSLIFDPACYWGDRETDLAMAELFGGFPRKLPRCLPRRMAAGSRLRNTQTAVQPLSHAQPLQPVRRCLPRSGRSA